MRRQVWTLVAFLAVVGCNSNDEKVFGDSGNVETKPAAILLDKATALNENRASKPVPVADITFYIEAESNSGAKICKGEVNILLKSNFAMEFPEAFMSCSSMTLNIEAVLGGGLGMDGQGGGDFVGQGKELPITHDGKVLYVEELVGVTFSGRGRPLLLGPLIRDNDEYKGFEKTIKTTAQAKDGRSATGTFTVKVLDHDAVYENDYMKKNGVEPFENVINWTIEAKGFKGFTMADGLVVDYMEWHWNTDPIMIPEVKIRGLIGDLIGSPDSANDLVGEISLNAKVKHYELLQ